jgi:hypothetical protein
VAKARKTIKGRSIGTVSGGLSGLGKRRLAPTIEIHRATTSISSAALRERGVTAAGYRSMYPIATFLTRTSGPE